MAEVVLGLGLSHSPQTCVPPELWEDLSANERGRSRLLGTDGELHTFEELEKLAPHWVLERLDIEQQRQDYARVERSIARLRKRLVETAPDVVLIIGDDQGELFRDDGMPMFAMYWGGELTDHSRSAEAVAKMSHGVRDAFLARHSPVPESYPVAAELARHLVVSSAEAGFDIFQFSNQRPDRSFGHAFTTVERRIMAECSAIPIIPIFQNTYFPPNQPSPLRCYEFGQMIQETLGTWEGAERVAVVASGGLSHITVDEELDEHVLAALTNDDRELVATLPRSKLRFGSSEVLNWVTAGGVLSGLEMAEVEYIASYRSPAGTGVGMCFAEWSPPAGASARAR